MAINWIFVLLLLTSLCAVLIYQHLRSKAQKAAIAAHGRLVEVLKFPNRKDEFYEEQALLPDKLKVKYTALFAPILLDTGIARYEYEVLKTQPSGDPTNRLSLAQYMVLSGRFTELADLATKAEVDFRRIRDDMQRWGTSLSISARARRLVDVKSKLASQQRNLFDLACTFSVSTQQSIHDGIVMAADLIEEFIVTSNVNDAYRSFQGIGGLESEVHKQANTTLPELYDFRRQLKGAERELNNALRNKQADLDNRVGLVSADRAFARRELQAAKDHIPDFLQQLQTSRDQAPEDLIQRVKDLGRSIRSIGNDLISVI